MTDAHCKNICLIRKAAKMNGEKGCSDDSIYLDHMISVMNFMRCHRVDILQSSEISLIEQPIIPVKRQQ